MTAFLEMAYESMGIVAYLWPVTLALVAAAVLALTIGSPLRDPQFQRRFGYLLVTYASPLALLLVGTIFRYAGPPHPNWQEPPDWYGVPLYAVLIAHAVALIAVPILMKGARLRSVAILLPGAWLALCCWFVAGLTMAGVGL